MAKPVVRITKDEITPALRGLTEGLKSKAAITGIANVAKAVIVNRTLAGESLTGGTFAAYSTRRYYAPTSGRAPGVPAPSGGRTTALRGGRRLKTVVYDEGYGQYKAALGRGGTPQLSLSGMMLDAMMISVVSARRAIIFFASADANTKAFGLHAGKFPFFGLRATDAQGLYAELGAQLRRIKGVTGR